MITPETTPPSIPTNPATAPILLSVRGEAANGAADVEAKDRMAEIARKALTNAEEHEARLMVEREALADHIAALVRLTDPALRARLAAGARAAAATWTWDSYAACLEALVDRVLGRR